MTVDTTLLFDAIDGTWPPARHWRVGQAVLRDGQGGGKRVSAATLDDAATLDAIDEAEGEMQRLDQPLLFRLRADQGRLDALLAGRGYAIVDPTVVLTAPIKSLTDVAIPPVTAFSIWEPLALMKEIWAQGGIGPSRLAVMQRATTKTAILARWNEKPAGVGFAAMHGTVCMVHAVEVLPHQRRQGVAGWIMRKAAFWSAAHGAKTISVLCTRSNGAALNLYQGLGFGEVAGYHYRQSEESR
ncbi:MAG: GNAT family N-acetyltransferase [Pseudomonadota bacterium]